MDKGEQIEVFGSRDKRGHWVVVDEEGARQRVELPAHERPKSFQITRAKSPVGNPFEADSSLSRSEQIQKFDELFWNDWVARGTMPDPVRKWIESRARDYKLGSYMDLKCNCRENRGGGWIKAWPTDCHGNTLKDAIIKVANGELDLDKPAS